MVVEVLSSCLPEHTATPDSSDGPSCETTTKELILFLHARHPLRQAFEGARTHQSNRNYPHPYPHSPSPWPPLPIASSSCAYPIPSHPIPLPTLYSRAYPLLSTPSPSHPHGHHQKQSFSSPQAAISQPCGSTCPAMRSAAANDPPESAAAAAGVWRQLTAPLVPVGRQLSLFASAVDFLRMVCDLPTRWDEAASARTS
jgi:hypothetical protein